MHHDRFQLGRSDPSSRAKPDLLTKQRAVNKNGIILLKISAQGNRRSDGQIQIHELL